MQLHNLPLGIFENNTRLEFLRLNDNDMEVLNGSAFRNMTLLKELWLQDNNFTELPPELFKDLKGLNELDLSNNELGNLPPYVFKNITAVKFMKMDYNKIERLHADQFQGLVEMFELHLSENRIEALPDKIFEGVKNLKGLNIFGNKIQNVTSTTFSNARELRFLFMHYNLMAELPKGFFELLPHIIRVTLDTNLMCCHLDLFRQDADCEFAFNDNFASCHSMFRNLAPRRSLWVVGLLSLFGSVFVVGWQYFLPDNNMVQSIMLVNLGISDGIMGIYLIIIGIKDLQWSGEYYLHDYEWRTGWFCHFNGAMSVLSSEVSVMMISLIAWDRLKNIVFPYTFAKITPRQTRIMCVVIWLVGGIMAFLPLSGMRYFGDWYYGKNVVCLPLQLSPQLQEGWEFSTSIFIVLNFSLFLFITVAYVAILLKSWSSSRRLGAHGTVREIRARAQSAQARRERALAKRVFFIILTDFLCWIPIIAIGIKSHVEKTFAPPGDLAVWIAVFALPINSAINPLLYTLSTPQVQAVLKAKLRKVWSNVRSIFSSGQNQEEGVNNQQGQIGNGHEHANNEEGEQIEMQVIEHNEVPEVEAPELPAPQPAMEQAYGGDENPSSSDYEDDFDIRSATKKTVEVAVHHGESQHRRKIQKEGQGGETKPETKELAEEADKSVEQVESEEITRASDKEGEKKLDTEELTKEAGKSEEKVESEEIPIPSDEAQKADEEEEEEKKRLEPDMEDTEKAGEEEVFDTRL